MRPGPAAPFPQMGTVRQATGGRTCLWTLMNVFVHVPWLLSCSMISRVSVALASGLRRGQSFTSVARFAPSNVEGHVCFSTTGALFDAV